MERFFFSELGIDPPRAVAAAAEFDLAELSVELGLQKRTLSSEREGGCVEGGCLLSATVSLTFMFAIFLLKASRSFLLCFPSWSALDASLRVFINSSFSLQSSAASSLASLALCSALIRPYLAFATLT